MAIPLILTGNLLIGVRKTRTVNDAVTNGTATVTSATAAFTANDVGRPLSGTNIPAVAFVGIVNSGTSIGMSSVQGSNTPVIATGSGSGGVLTIGAYDPMDEDNAIDVGYEISKIVIKVAVDTITVPATVGNPEGHRGGAADYSLELAYIATDGNTGVVVDLLHTAATTDSKELGFWGSMRNATISAQNPLWSGTFIVAQVEVGGDAQTLSVGGATFPLVSVPTQVTADY